MLPLSCPAMGHYAPKLTSCTNYTTHLIFDTVPIKTLIFLLLFSSLSLSRSPWKYISNHSYSLFSFPHQSIICTFTRELYFRFSRHRWTVCLKQISKRHFSFLSSAVQSVKGLTMPFRTELRMPLTFHFISWILIEVAKRTQNCFSNLNVRKHSII